MAAVQELHTLPISSRPWRTWVQLVNMVLCLCTFLIGCIMINGSQFLFLLPLALLPFPWAQRMYLEGVRYSKGAFGMLLGV